MTREANCKSSEFNFELSEAEIERYSRQLILSNWGLAQQLRLKSTSVLLPGDLEITALYLASAGVGNIFLCQTAKSGQIKALIAHLRAQNPHISVSEYDFHNGIEQKLPMPCFALWPDWADCPRPEFIANCQLLEPEFPSDQNALPDTNPTEFSTLRAGINSASSISNQTLLALALIDSAISSN